MDLPNDSEVRLDRGNYCAIFSARGAGYETTILTAMKTGGLFALVFLILATACNRNQYRVIERTDIYRDKQGNQLMDALQASYDHDEIHFVLKRGSQKIHATCDLSTVNNLDPHATCAMRVLQEYRCTQDRKQVSAHALADLFCKDSEGGTVYLYVSKEEQ